MKKVLSLLFILVSISTSLAQTISGTIKDATTGETLIGASILYGNKQGVVTNIDGKYTIKAKPNTKYTLEVSYVGYTKTRRTVTVGTKDVKLNISLEAETLEGITLVADIAKERKTPVAFTTIKPRKLEEELGGRDIPLVLNQTPGAYATEQGGGDGDARINIRGFKQENMAVLIDGIPVNDMENGAVYWSNWFGLNNITSNIQVQRGLSASKLSIPSVGGTMNILTSNAISKKFIKVKQTFNQFGKSESSIAYNSGLNDKGWNFTLTGSYKRGRGFVENTNVEGFFAYAKVTKELGNHMISLSAFAAPQKHDQRKYKQYLAVYDTNYAKELGVDLSRVDPGLALHQGSNFNRDWGYIRRTKDNPNAPKEALAEKSNFYNKPQFNLNHDWIVNDKLTLSNAAYLSIGRGGGVELHNASGNLTTYDSDGRRVNWQKIYDRNAFGDPEYQVEGGTSTNFLIAKRNDHNWFGLLSKLDYNPTDEWNISGGLDLRSYEGKHYNEIHDLLGGDSVRTGIPGIKGVQTLYEGDILEKDFTSYIKWAGAFTQAEYTSGSLTAFINLSTSVVSGRKTLHIPHPTADFPLESDVLSKIGGTIKSGLNYNLDENSNIFVNLGWLNKARPFANLFQGGNSTIFLDNTKNENVLANEIGYSYGSENFSVNSNAYYTLWIGKSVRSLERNGILTVLPPQDARHMGIEIDGTYKFSKKLELQGTVSLGDWIYTSQDSATVFENGKFDKKKYINLKGIHVGDAPQVQIGGSLQYSPIKNGFIRARYMHNSKYYSDFEIRDLLDKEEVVDPWKIPSYGLLDLTLGYNFKVKKSRVNWTLNVFNVLNTTYIAGAKNNDTYGRPKPTGGYTNDSNSATVFLGMGRMFSTSVKITL
jgi:hypothetical protein